MMNETYRKLRRSLGIEEAIYHKCGLGLDYVEVETLDDYIKSLLEEIEELNEKSKRD